MICDVSTYTPEKLVTYYSDSDYEYGIHIGEKFKFTMDSELSTWIIGVLVEVGIDDFIIQKQDGERAIIQCSTIYNIHCEEEIGTIN